MNKVTRINPHMFNLLIEKRMDGFSVIDARDALLSSNVTFPSKDDARKYIYKQLLSFEEKGWLATIGTYRSKRYRQTSEFKALTVEPRVARKSKVNFDPIAVQTADTPLMVLEQEKKQYEGELAITLGEIEEYQSLLTRFPHSRQKMQPLFNAARERSAKLLGKINALTNWIQVVQGRALQC
ncbi:hypothetical protein [Vibrio cholerae]|jgi:hypothetical protein|uniref:hypothetical protein n=1 Tax=Vibrio cholerae TaxID=666 RepID=UPI0028BC7597|nr:hypothetical protein [Vibrio cholerae]MDV2382417.1 hypothetical protein [Vibrio cholerae]HDI3200190.1 hypothetical protein [Vibrio cholerae]HDI3321990.1 hypothetical protein [Vibrio cholerae]HDZ3741384.1 hypothetical protein [Vibrio cholerae]HDZ3762131.1 hypothetical protein [Vibrio cholerae]